MLMAQLHVEPLYILKRRHELSFQSLFVFAPLFNGFNPKINNQISVKSKNSSYTLSYSCEDYETIDKSSYLWESTPSSGMKFHLDFKSLRDISLDFRSSSRLTWLGVKSIIVEDIIFTLNRLMLTPSEEILLDSLRILEPRVRRISPDTSTQHFIERGGVKVLLEGESQPQNITSMGEGTWRILGIILSLIRSENGCLLIDEIDTGLHYSTLKKVWEVIFKTAEALNVQVFATTHSSDCWRAFAEAMTEDQDASLQRIEGEHAVAYPPEVLKSADEWGLEVR